MGDSETRFRQAYDVLLEQMPDPPDFEKIAIIGPRSLMRIRGPMWAAIASAVGVVALVGGLAVFQDSTGGGQSNLSAPSTSPVATTEPQPNRGGVGAVPHYIFGRSLPWTLVFDDGYDKLMALDVDSGVPYLSEVPGGRAGDQPYRLTKVGDRLIVGWGEIYAYDMTTRESGLLGEATVYLPAAEPDRVWLVDVADPYSTVWQVSLDGQRLTDPVTVEGGRPVMGIPGGLAVLSDDELSLWDLERQSVFRTLGRGHPSDATSTGLIAWCESASCDLHVTDMNTGEDILILESVGGPFVPRLARFSPNARFLAAPTSNGVVVADLATGESWFAIDFSEEGLYFANWAPTGADLFAASYSYGQRAMEIAYHNPFLGETSTARLPFGGTLDFVVVPTDATGSLLTPESLVCPVTVPTPSGFLAPEPWPAYYPSDSNWFWYGTEDLWTALPINPGDYEWRKSVWWSANFPGGSEESRPPLAVTWRRLDLGLPAITAFHGTNATTADLGWFMIGGIDPQEPGCWQVTASYKGATLSYVYDNR